METKFTNSKKEKVSVATELSLSGINISIHAFGQKKVIGNGEVLSEGHVAGDANQVFNGDDLANIKSVDIAALIEKAIEDFKNK